MGKQVSSFVVWARDPSFKNSIVLDVNKSNEITEWCVENLSGSFGYTYRSGQRKPEGWKMIVYEESDAMAFKLRWL